MTCPACEGLDGDQLSVTCYRCGRGVDAKPTYDPYNIPPPRRPRDPWWRSRPALVVYLVVFLAAEYMFARWLVALWLVGSTR